MEIQDAVDLGREALWISLVISAPMFLTGMLVGLAIGLLQALTQVQEQTVAFVPKMVIMVIVVALMMPWLLTRLLEYSSELIHGIPERFL